VFPRYHQLDAVRALEKAARAEGPGRSYLIQHSAGSGKSNSIAWLAYRLATLYRDDDSKVFDAVVVVTDRRVLDRQLQSTIAQFEPTPGFVQKIDRHSAQLAAALERGASIIVTTLQKFPIAAQAMSGLPKRAYAVIIDEAHSSQGGEASKDMKRVLGTADEEDDPALRAARMATARGPQKNLSMFAFPATPKPKTLEVFGRRTEENQTPKAFHIYSMRQAIAEGFILDVLERYTTYRAYYKLIKTVATDPEVEKRRASSQLRRFAQESLPAVKEKTRVMVEHFRAEVAHEIGGRAKAMVVTSSRQQAVDCRRRKSQQQTRPRWSAGSTRRSIGSALSGTTRKLNSAVRSRGT
jgi:type I restriction enzyme, R subunit